MSHFRKPQLSRFLTLLLVFVCLLFTLISCQTPESSSPKITSPPLNFRLGMSNAPKLGETTDLSLILNVEDIGGLDTSLGQTKENLTNARTWVEFYWMNISGQYSEARQGIQIPNEKVFVSNDLASSMNALTGKVELHSTVRFPKEGVWWIKGHFSGDGWKKSIDSIIRIAVTKDTAAIFGTEEFDSSPLAYLNNFTYGGSGAIPPSQSQPFGIELDISKAPRVGEEVILTCKMISLQDADNFTAKIEFSKRQNDGSLFTVSSNNLVQKGDIQWTGNLKKGESVTFTTSVKFPEAGNWEIYAQENSEQNIKNQKIGAADSIKFNIGELRSSFGWDIN
jgi:hypothetical protein